MVGKKRISLLIATPIILPDLAFASGLTAAFLIFLFAYRRGIDISPTGLILTGVAKRIIAYNCASNSC
ncbi:hypothetical protein B4V02_13465 [Paenibacillus kribbensis]|uniref:Uncharacterized protein n=1 Tax=Paenibacillus kribbensis TaxID=172713 RepID=A0A222WM80_9BACL|nr:hypothetical protein B4V02_13465 [Paenibacillus kribbensis]